MYAQVSGKVLNVGVREGKSNGKQYPYIDVLQDAPPGVENASPEIVRVDGNGVKVGDAFNALCSVSVFEFASGGATLRIRKVETAAKAKF